MKTSEHILTNVTAKTLKSLPMLLKAWRAASVQISTDVTYPACLSG